MLIKLEYETLLRVKLILEQLGNISGLLCNVEKTNLLPLGENINFDERIYELGFNIVNKLTVLGLEVDRNGVTENNFSRIADKINALIANWRPYNLSLPGRINIAKSLLYSQINYLGCFQSFPARYIEIIDNAITSFVKGKLNIAKKRLYTTPKEGGLGLFDLNTFLHAQRCAWVKRCLTLDEQWKVQLFINNFGNVLNCKAKYTSHVTNPILHDISKSFELMYEGFTRKDENFRSAYIVGNRCMTRNLETKDFITNSFFGHEFFVTHAGNICRLRYSDFYNETGSMIPSNMVIANTGVPLSVMMIQTLRGVCSVARIKYCKKNLEERKCIDIQTFISRCKRGSKRFRLLMSKNPIRETPHNINKFARNMDIIIDGSQSEFLNSLWTVNYFSNSMKTFIFKLHNNTLGYNNAVAHFVRNHSPYCTFCDLTGDADINIESGPHLFFDCVHVSDAIDFIFETVTQTPNFEFSRREFFATFNRRESNTSRNMVLTLVSKLTMKSIWDCKLRFTVTTGRECWDTIRD
jgi:hypothetical protein